MWDRRACWDWDIALQYIGMLLGKAGVIQNLPQIWMKMASPLPALSPEMSLTHVIMFVWMSEKAIKTPLGMDGLHLGLEIGSLKWVLSVDRFTNILQNLLSAKECNK